MTQTASPYNGGPPMEEADWTTLLMTQFEDGVINRFAPPQGGMPQTLHLYTDVDGRQVKVSPGNAVIHGKLYRNDALVTLPIDPNSTLLPSGDLSIRRDRVVVRSNESSIARGSVPATSARLVVIKGSDVVNGALPPLTYGTDQLYDLELGYIGAGQLAPGQSFNALGENSVARTRRFVGNSQWQPWSPTFRLVDAIGEPITSGYNFDQTIQRARWRQLDTLRAEVQFNSLARIVGNQRHLGIEVTLPTRTTSPVEFLLGEWQNSYIRVQKNAEKLYLFPLTVAQFALGSNPQATYLTINGVYDLIPE